MATTAKGTPYVESSDLVANYPAVSLALAEHIDDFGGKILQVVRATDTTNRSTTSTSFVDASISVTISPKYSTSAVIIIWAVSVHRPTAADLTQLRIADSSNNAIGGSQTVSFGAERALGTLIGYATPATTSATTYKGRFLSVVGNTTTLENANNTGQMYAIEVSA